MPDGSLSQAKCNSSEPDQRFIFDAATKTITLGKHCLTAGPKGNDTWLRLQPCAPGSAAQQFHTAPKHSPVPPMPPPPPPYVPTTYILDPSAAGSKRFDGHGGLSAGASSRLLLDYPEPQRSDILDYLYLPNFGAAIATGRRVIKCPPPLARAQSQLWSYIFLTITPMEVGT